MLLKSVFISCLLLLSWEFSAAYYLPNTELEIVLGEPDNVPYPRMPSPLMNQWMEKRMKDIYMIFDSKANEESAHQNQNQNQNQLNLNYQLQSNIDNLMRVIKEFSNELASLKQTEIEKMIEQKTEKLQTQLTTNTASIEDLQSQLAKLIADANVKDVEMAEKLKQLENRIQTNIIDAKVNESTDTDSKPENVKPIPDEIESVEEQYVNKSAESPESPEEETPLELEDEEIPNSDEGDNYEETQMTYEQFRKKWESKENLIYL